MANINRVIISGNLTKNPELKPVSTGKVCNINLVINRSFKNNFTGKDTQEMSYADVAVWGDRGVDCHKNLKMGDSVLIDGRLKSGSWTDNTGQSRSKLSIMAENVVFLGHETETAQQQAATSTDVVQLSEASANAKLNDELPF